MNPVFEGGQMPLVRRVPKRGFNNKQFAEVVVAVNIGDLELYFNAGDTVTPEVLVAKGVVKKVFDRIKVLGNGEFSKKLEVKAHAFSATAAKRIEEAGGKAVTLPAKKAVIKNKMGSRKAERIQAKTKSAKTAKAKS